jgi:hypothetical protein
MREYWIPATTADIDFLSASSGRTFGVRPVRVTKRI